MCLFVLCVCVCVCVCERDSMCVFSFINVCLCEYACMCVCSCDCVTSFFPCYYVLYVNAVRMLVCLTASLSFYSCVHVKELGCRSSIIYLCMSTGDAFTYTSSTMRMQLLLRSCCLSKKDLKRASSSIFFATLVSF